MQRIHMTKHFRTSLRLFLYQKEGWEASTCPRLQISQWAHSARCIPFTFGRRTHRSIPWCYHIHEIRPPMGVQQCAYHTGRPMEGSVSLQIWNLWTGHYVLWTDKFTSVFPKIHDKRAFKIYPRRVVSHLHGQHINLFK